MWSSPLFLAGLNSAAWTRLRPISDISSYALICHTHEVVRALRWKPELSSLPLVVPHHDGVNIGGVRRETPATTHAIVPSITKRTGQCPDISLLMLIRRTSAVINFELKVLDSAPSCHACGVAVLQITEYCRVSPPTGGESAVSPLWLFYGLALSLT